MNGVKALVIGGGIAGCCAAHLMSEKGIKVTLIESKPFLGGGCKTFYYGGHPYTVGPRHFLTQKEELFEFLNRYVLMRRIEMDHYNLSYVEQDKQFYSYPLHVDDIPLMPDYDQISEEIKQERKDLSKANFEDYIIGSYSKTLYSKFFETYSKKIWKINDNKELDGYDWGLREVAPKGMSLRTASRAAWEGFISAFPLKMNGYDDYFDIATQNTEVHLNTTAETYDVENYRVKIEGEWRRYDIIVSTTSPVILLNNIFGPLRWIGRDFFKIVLPVKEVFPPQVYFLYYTNKEPFSRIVEYKKFYRYESPTTLLGLEIPSYRNKLYPYPTQKDQALAQKYFDVLPKNVFSIGRVGTYRHLDMGNIIQQCMDLVKKLA